MSVRNWQAWMALLPCERCGWTPWDCGCHPASQRSLAEIETRHRIAVRRARHSGWPVRTLSEVRSDYLPVTRRGAA